MRQPDTYQPTVFPVESIERFRTLLDSARRITLTCHVSPDGDALGSTLALASLLRARGKDARVITPDEPPHYLRVIPGARNIMAWSSFGHVVDNFVLGSDLIICMDFNVLSRLSRLAPTVEKAKARKILIDHHKFPEDFADVTFSYPTMSSTCQLTYLLLEAAGMTDEVSFEVATCLMSGILTDTGGLQYNSNDPELYGVISHLMSRGVDKDRLTRFLVNTQSADSMRLESFAIAERMEVFADAHAALITLSRDDLNAYRYRKGDTEGLVNRPLAIPGIIYTCYLREEKDYIKVSMRSLVDFPVDHLCREYFNGGGHLNAAGGEFYGSLEAAAETFRSTLEKNMSLISPEALRYACRQNTKD